MKKRIWILTLFPDFFKEFLNVGVIGQALQGKRGPGLEINIVNIRDFGMGNYKAVDDTPYGGGPGMILRADCLADAFKSGVLEAGGYGKDFKSQLWTVFTSPRGKKWDRHEVKNYSEKIENHDDKDLVFLCGRYEGVDERFLQSYVDEEICLGDFILSGGELAVMMILDSSLRHVKGILGNKKSSEDDSFESDLLEHPQYTRPEVFEDVKIPEVIASGHHKNIEQFHLGEAKRITEKHRPDLWEKYLRKSENKK